MCFVFVRVICSSLLEGVLFYYFLHDVNCSNQIEEMDVGDDYVANVLEYIVKLILLELGLKVFFVVGYDLPEQLRLTALDIARVPLPSEVAHRIGKLGC